VTSTTQKQAKCKPFLKWAGGKGQLIAEIDKRLPDGLRNGSIDTYVEPFVGGGAVFFHIAQNYPIKHFYLLDINQDLVNCYLAVQQNVKSLIAELRRLENTFLAKGKEQRKKFFYDTRFEFNKDRSSAKLIFLNKTCYNGLYRVNRKDGFNVPFGGYKKPKICDAENLKNVSEVLQNAEIIYGDFEECYKYIDNHIFVYFDPPYRPISSTASFTSYSKVSFSEEEQVRLARFCRQVNTKGAEFLLSNSDPKDGFFEKNYGGFTIERVKASRVINCKASGRGQIDELIITNYRIY
jgi:DNA adenine methylase